jgi:hypothetical protein
MARLQVHSLTDAPYRTQGQGFIDPISMKLEGLDIELERMYFFGQDNGSQTMQQPCRECSRSGTGVNSGW